MGCGGGYTRSVYPYRRQSTDVDIIDSIGKVPVLTLGFSLLQDLFLFA